MENTKKGNLAKKALMMGSALVALNGLAVAEAQAATLTNASMSAIILAPIVLTNPTALHFGSFTIGTANDTITVTPGGARTAGGAPNGITLVTGGGLESNGVINMVSAGGAINVSITAATFTVENTTTAADTPMNVNGFAITALTGAFSATGTNVMAVTGAGTNININVGATLNGLAANSAVNGTYTGTFGIAANYP